VARLQKIYQEKVVPSLMKQLDLKNPMEVPRLRQIVVSSSTGEAVQNPKVLDKIGEEVSLITGQKAALRRARKSIAGFKLRAGMPLGVMATLRRERMYEFFDRLVNFSLPRVRDFRGLSPKSFDGRGNYTLGIKEQIIFPEINYDRVDKIRGLNITFVTNAKNNEQGRLLLKELGFPFRS
jgi:large subunit ribosomal protein L5